MKVLFYDLSKTCTGWAVDSDDEPGRPFVGSYKGAAGIKGERAGVRILGVVADHVKLFQPEMIGIEAPALGSRKIKGTDRNVIMTSYDLIGIAYLVGVYALANGMRFEKVNANTVRKTFLDSGNANKSQVFDRCRLLGWHCTNEDESDACAGWYHLKSTFDPAYRPETGQPLFGAKR